MHDRRVVPTFAGRPLAAFTLSLRQDELWPEGRSTFPGKEIPNKKAHLKSKINLDSNSSKRYSEERYQHGHASNQKMDLTRPLPSPPTKH
ncbi:hypothetical protein CRG98_037763 [Punica granatum]|uniref:Uncharacterized protein n=1 Tax=Punica granatum TaxID=22663 RepID=A0A2I0IER3_PUNGR|nr:hypothetical protein CRG98_037763 [Punica granatum]